MLITCPECGHEISTKATICPGCGYSVDKAVKEEALASYLLGVGHILGFGNFKQNYEEAAKEFLKAAEL